MHHGAEQTTHWNTFLTPEVPRVFGLDLPQIHNFSPNITAAILPEAIRQNVDVAPSVELISDGVLRLRQYVKTPIVANATVLVDVPGLGRIARCLIDRDSGRISDPLCLANPAELRTILSKSPSAFASELSELLHQVEPAAELSEMTRTVVEVMEDEAVLADIHGNAIIIAADKNNLTVPARVIGYRSKVQAIQSGKLETCRLLHGFNQSFGFIVHGSSPITFGILSASIGTFLQQIAPKPEGVMLGLFSDYISAFESGDIDEHQEYVGATRLFASSYLGSDCSPKDINAPGCCQHLTLGKITTNLIPIL